VLVFWQTRYGQAAVFEKAASARPASRGRATVASRRAVPGSGSQ
jgi:hypothetical protein